jgi:hypothetical protein
MMSKSSVLLACIAMIVGIVSVPAVFADIIVNANESCRASVDTTDPADNPDENDHNSSKLSVRTSDEKSSKSWIKFDLGELHVGNLETATLTVALHEPKDGDGRHFDVSYVNDDCLDNIGWDERSLTWNNAPGNDTTDHGLLDPTKTTYLGTVNFADGAAGDPFTIDILEALQADTDGIVQFVLHNGSALLQFATHDHATEAWRPFIDATYISIPTQAHDPQPEDNETGVPVVNTTLSWKAGLDPNDPNVPNPNITHHYLWLSLPYDPDDQFIPAQWWNEVSVQKLTIAADTDPADGNVDPNASKTINGLQKDKLYLWFVDEGLAGNSGPDEADPTKIIWGNEWRFETEKSGPAVDAGDSIITWLEGGTTTVDLNGAVTDSSGDVSVIQWSVLSPPGAAVDIADTAAAATTATLTETGTYMLQLYARDATMQEDNDAIEIKVYNDSCEAAKNNPAGYTAPEFDFNDDCVQNFSDFVLFAANWLESTSLTTELLYDAGEVALPVVQFTNPLNGAVVSAEVVINVISYDPSVGTNDGDGMEGTGGIDFDILDSSGTGLAAGHDGTASFDMTWNTAQVDVATSLPIFPNGVYTITVTAESDAGHEVIDEISVTVSN